MNKKNYGHYILVLWLTTIGYPLFKLFVYLSYNDIEPIYYRAPTFILGISFLLGFHFFPKMKEVVNNIFLIVAIVTTVEFLFLVSKYFNTSYGFYYFIGSFVVTIGFLVAFKEKKTFFIYLSISILSYLTYLGYTLWISNYHFKIEVFNQASFIFTAFLIVGIPVWNNIKNEASLVEATKKMEEQKLQLINSSKMASLGEMAGGIAHEINNPLQIISGNIEILEMDPRNTEALENIKETIIRVNKTVEGLRIFSRDGKSSSYEPTLLIDVVNETLNLCNEKFKMNGITLNVNVSSFVYIKCNHVEISRVFLNLLNNAFDAIEEESNGKREVNISTELESNFVTVIFQDSGKDISKEAQNKLFQPFFTTKAIGKGTGLGLSISRGIIENHEGSIFLDLNPKSFKIVLPINQV